MQPVTHLSSSASFTTFGDLLKFLRRRRRLTQLELSLEVGYSETQITRLEKNQRLPDVTAVRALFIPALELEEDSELGARLLELAQHARLEDAPAPGLPPYKGLLFFDETDAGLFFGREELTAHLADRVAALGMDGGSRFLAVVGASGSGKSSLMRAGLEVALKRAGWQARILTPTADPLRKLETEMSPLPDDGKPGRSLLIVDQFEETFTLCRSEVARVAFIERLLSLASTPLSLQGRGAGGEGHTAVVIAMRADFYSHCAQYPTLRQAVAAEQEYIGQMSAGELRRAIEEPARQGGWEFEPGLVDVLLRDIGAGGSESPEPGALPLLSHALLATWDRRCGRTLTLEGYHASGGVRGAIAETAENVFNDQLNAQQKELAQDIFLRLTELGEGTEDTRRRATLNELARQADEAAALRGVLNTLAEARLITLSEDSAEVAHEALIREWQRLHEWLTRDRDGLRLHRHLTETAREWEGRGCDPGELYRGARLAQAREWAASNERRLNPDERAFLDASYEQEQRDALEREILRERELEAAQRLAEEREQAARRLRRRAYLLGGALALALALAGIAILFGGRVATSAAAARRQERLAFARELVAASINSLGADPELSVLLALHSARVSMQAGQPVLIEAQGALHRSLQSMRLLATWQAHDADVLSVVISPDGKQLATLGADGTAKVWDRSTGQVIYTFPTHVTGNFTGVSVAFNADGSQLLTLGSDNTLILWDLSTGEPMRTLRQTDPGSIDPLSSVAVSPDGELAAGGGRYFSRIYFWDAISGELLKIFSGTGSGVGSLAFSPDNRYIYSSRGQDGHATRWNYETGVSDCCLSTEAGALGPDAAAALSPDGALWATAGRDGTIRIWDAGSATLRIALFGRETGQVAALAFSRKGDLLASASDDGTATVWDAASGREMLVLAGHAGGVLGVAFSPDSDMLYTASRDGTVKVWDISPAAGSDRLNIRHDSGVFSVAYSPDGSRLATWSTDGTARIWDAETGKPLLVLEHDPGESGGNVSYSPDGKRLAVVSGNSALIYDGASGELIRRSAPLPGRAGSVLFSPDGSRLAVSTLEGIVKISDSATGANSLIFAAVRNGVIRQTAFSADGARLATATNLGTSIWDAVTGEKILDLVLDSHGLDSRGVAFSPDGTLLATTGDDARVRIWDAETGEPLFVLAGFTAPTLGVAFSADGGSIAASSMDKTAKVWQMPDAGDRFPPPLTLYGHTAEVHSLAFSPDGTLLATAGASPIVRTYPLEIEDLITLAESRLTRRLTEAECQQYLHADACPDEP